MVNAGYSGASSTALVIHCPLVCTDFCARRSSFSSAALGNRSETCFPLKLFSFFCAMILYYNCEFTQLVAHGTV